MERKVLKEMGLSDENINAIMKEYGESVNTYKTQLDDINSKFSEYNSMKTEYDTLKTELETIKKATMTKEELDKEREKQLEKALNEAKLAKIEALKEKNRVKAESILVKAGITEEETLNKLISGIINENADITIANATAIAQVINQTKDNTEKVVKENLMKEEPKPTGGDDSKAKVEITLDKFREMDVVEKQELCSKDNELYEKLKNQLLEE